jgi:hypothetical protein
MVLGDDDVSVVDQSVDGGGGEALGKIVLKRAG